MRTNFFRKNPFYKEIIYSATHFMISIFRKKKASTEYDGCLLGDVAPLYWVSSPIS